MARWGLFFSALASGTAAAIFFALGAGFTREPIGPSEAFELIKVALTVAGGLGAVVALAVAFRRQSLSEEEHVLSLASRVQQQRSEFRDRFETASKLMDETGSAATRIAGITMLMSLADDWPVGRQSCLDLLCSYFRALSIRAGRDGSEPDSDAVVRREVLHALSAASASGDLLQGARLDLSDCVFRSESLQGLRLIDATLVLSRSTVTGQGLNLSDIDLRGSTVSAHGLRLMNGALSLDSGRIEDSLLDFSEAVLDNGVLSLSNMCITGSEIRLKRAELGASAVIYSEDLVFEALGESAAVINLRELMGRGGLIWIRGSSPASHSFDPLATNSDDSIVLVDLSLARLDHSVALFEEIGRAAIAQSPHPYRIVKMSHTELVNASTIHFDRCSILGSIDGPNLRMQQSALSFDCCTFGSETGREAGRAILDNMAAGHHERDYADHYKFNPAPSIDLVDSRFVESQLVWEFCRVYHGMIDLIACEVTDSRVTVKSEQENGLAINLSRAYFQGASTVELLGLQQCLIAATSQQIDGRFPVPMLEGTDDESLRTVSTTAED